MNAIMEFLASNIFVVVIVIGFILSLIRKARGSMPRMPDFGGGGFGDPNAPDARKPTGGQPRPQRDGRPVSRPSPFPSAQQMAARPAEAPVRETAVSADEGLSGGEGLSTEYSEERPYLRADLPSVQAAADAQPAEGGRSPVNLGAENLRQAVLWAEILGPPRAKRPLRRP